MQVLIIEDSEFWGTKLQVIAEKCGLDVLSIIDNLNDAKLFLTTTIPDIIIADIMLGDNIIFELYKSKHIKKIPTVFITASEQKIFLEKAMQIDNATFLVKPFHPHSLKAAINLITAKSESKVGIKPNENQIIRQQFNEMFSLLDNTKLIDKFNIGERETEVVLQRLRDNKNFGEIADKMGFSSENARKLFYRGLKKLITKINNAQSRYSHFLEFTMYKQNKVEINKTLANKNLGINNNIIANEDFLKQNLDELQLLGTKWKNVLHQKKIDTIEDLIQLSRRQLLLLPIFGEYAVSQIELELSKYGLELKK